MVERVNAYPLAAKQTVSAVSEALKDRKEGCFVPVSAVAYEAAAYRVQPPLWSPDSENFVPFQHVNSKDALPVSWRRSMQASAAAFDVLAYVKMVADAQVKALKEGFASEEETLAFQASSEALALAASDALALTSVGLANATLMVRQRALSQVKPSPSVRDHAWTSELAPDAWFGPAAATAMEEEKRDPTV